MATTTAAHGARWAADVTDWAVGSADWARALALLPESEARQVTRFLFAKDQKLALASRLLQRALICALFGDQWRAIDLARTPEHKPFWRRPRARASPPATWNFNVSHHGAVAVIACHARALVGVDVVRASERPRGGTTAAEFFRAFAGYFTPLEWTFIRESEREDTQFARFYRLWSLKEAFIKAVGIGLGFELQRVEFSPCKRHVEDGDKDEGEGDGESAWTMRLDGRVAGDWAFESGEIDGDHVVSVAYGPVRDMWRSGQSGDGSSDGSDASSIFPLPVAELATLSSTGSGYNRDADRSEWRMLSLRELIAFAEGRQDPHLRLRTSN